jgi:ubiquinone/menaquinone biosynthesis C-methylase UbiE
MADAMSAEPHRATAVPIGNAYDKYSASNPIERRLMQGFFRALDACLPTAAPATVLEVGMGEAEIASRIRERYPAASIVGIDLPDADLAAAWDEKGIAGAFADIARLPFPSESVDLVLAIEVLEHVPDPDAALRDLARVGRGSFVLSVPHEPIWRVANMARGKYLRDLGNTPGHIQHWSQRSFRRQVAAHLDVQSSASPFPWTMVSARTRRPAIR